MKKSYSSIYDVNNLGLFDKKNINNIKNNKVTLLIFNIQFFSKILS